MASTMRSVDTRFWSDTWVRRLNALDRYAFLYFLTNEHSSWCGVYEVDISMIAFETGIDEHDLKRSILPRLAPKVLYIDGWVYIRNFEKYHTNRSEKTQKGIAAAWESVPEEIRRKIRAIENKEIPHRRGIQGVSPSASASASASAPTVATGVAAQQVNEIIMLFEDVNPLATDLLGNVTERKAVTHLISKFGYEKVKNMVAALAEITSQKYAPRITKPTELKRDLGKLLTFVKQEQKKGKTNVAFT